MAHALPVTLGPDVLPRPELRALVLDGVLWPLDRTFHPIDEPDRPGLRADALFRALHVDLSRRRGAHPQTSLRKPMPRPAAYALPFIAGGLSAAWVHGAVLVPPRVHEVLARAPARVPRPRLDSDWHVAQASIRDEDVCLRGGWPVLTELATALALAQTLTGAGHYLHGISQAGSHPPLLAESDRRHGGPATSERVLPGRRARDDRANCTAALTALLLLAGLDAVRAHLDSARPRRGTRAHEATALIGRIVRNLEGDILFAAQRDAVRGGEADDGGVGEANGGAAGEANAGHTPPRLRGSATPTRDSILVSSATERPRLTEQKRSTPRYDPREDAVEQTSGNVL